MDRSERQALLSRLRADAARIADRFDLRFSAIDAEHPRVKSRYGVCYETGLIKIRLNHAKTGKPLKYSSLVDTLCHELAHLRHFNHGAEFKAFFLQLLAWTRRQGIYQPSPRQRRGRKPDRTASIASAQPRRRDGVPVFGDPEPARPGPPPWQRLAEDRPTSPSETTEGGDLPLWCLPVATAKPRTEARRATGARPAAGKGRRRPTVKPPRPLARQLSLFD